MPSVSVAPVEVMSPAASVSSAGVPVAPSDHSPLLPVFFERTRTVYCVLFVRLGIVAEFGTTLVCRFAASHPCTPDFHCTS